MKILSISSSRADIGILYPIWKALSKEPNVDLSIFFTGMHMLSDSILCNAIPDNIKVYKGGSDLGGEGGQNSVISSVDIQINVGKICKKISPDIVMLIGDRLDMIPAAIATLSFGIPLIHIAGGDLSEGAVDDRIRHALTKLSHVHFVINEKAAYRVCGMGEEPWRIHVVGATGLDTLSKEPIMDISSFSNKIGLDSIKGLRLITVHPETLLDVPHEPLDVILESIENNPFPTLFTSPNSDQGGLSMRNKILNFVSNKDWAVFIDTLGSNLYANSMYYSTVMLGNSSSGIVEAALFGLNVINVGDRQFGRLHGDNVFNCPNSPIEISKLLQKLTTTATRSPSNSLYGDGHASKRITDVILSLPYKKKLLRKNFYEGKCEFKVPWNV
jgi:GDP/UDP-N,N'-diacetylbacillosamine 2-epimerase (hydrolysing)